jgi:hypothetical protein
MLTQQILPLGFNWVGIVVYCYQDLRYSDSVDCSSTFRPTASDEEIEKIADRAHGLGLRVMLHPQLVACDYSLDCTPPLDIVSDYSESEWASWFENYIPFITHYAGLAEEIGVDYFVIGNELAYTTYRDLEWREVVASVRALYSGSITYAALPFGEADVITWWDEVDAIGINAYYSLSQTNSPTVQDLMNAWVPIISHLEDLSDRWDKPILFTEIGYSSRDGESMQPADPFLCSAVDLQEQADLYKALLESFEGKSWWRGVFWWAWDGDPGQGGPYDRNAIPLGKPAENVIRSHYGGLPPTTDASTTIMLEDPSQQLVIYSDFLKPGWYLYENGVNVDFYYQDDVYLGEKAIRLLLEGSLFELLPVPAIDMTPYYWLEFYVKYTGEQNLTLNLGVGNWSPLLHEVTSLTVDISDTNSRDGWSRIRIPLEELFAAETIEPGRMVTELRFGFNFGCQWFSTVPEYEYLLVDEIRLVGAQMP